MLQHTKEPEQPRPICAPGDRMPSIHAQPLQALGRVRRLAPDSIVGRHSGGVVHMVEVNDRDRGLLAPRRRRDSELRGHAALRQRLVLVLAVLVGAAREVDDERALGRRDEELLVLLEQCCPRQRQCVNQRQGH